MPDMRAVIAVAVPAVTALLGLIWFLGKKKPPSQKKLVVPPDKLQNSIGDKPPVNCTKVGNDTSRKEVTTRTAPTKKDDAQQEIVDVARKVVEISIESAQAMASKNSASSGDKTGSSNALLKEAVVNEQMVKPVSVSSVSCSGDAKVSLQQCKKTDSDEASGEPVCLLESQLEQVEEQIVSSISKNVECETSSRCCEKPVEECIQSSSVPQTQCSASSNCENIQTPDSNSSSSKSTEILQTETKLENQVLKSPNTEDICLAPAWIQSKNGPLRKKSPETQLDTKQDITSDNASDKTSETKDKSATELNSIDNVVGEKKTSVVEKEVSKTESESSMSKSWHEEVDADVELNKPTEEIVEVPSSQTENSVHAESPRSKTKTSESVKKGSPSRSKKPEMNGVVNDKSRSPVSNSSSNSRNNVTRRQPSDNKNGSEGSSNCDNSSEASNDSGRGGTDEERVYEFNIPSDLCGMFIGTRGKNVRQLREQSGANIRLKNNPYTPEFQICVVEGPQSAIESACELIKRRFPTLKFPGMDTAMASPVIVPEIMQLSLPEGVSVDVVVSSIVEAGRIFVQQPTHPSFPSLERLNNCMNQCYVQEGNVPDIPRPIETGVICAAPMLNGWYRAQIMATTETDEVDIKYVDYGGYSRISSLCLKQIRSDFMTLPFEAVECYLANITPLSEENYFSMEAAAVLEELTQGKLLQAQVVGHSEDGLPYINLFMLGRNTPALLVNREMVERGVVRWLEESS